MYKNIQIIAEVKTVSPFGYRSEKSWEELFQIAEKVGDIISVHTDPRWGGSLELLKKARTLTPKAILAKGFHGTDDDIKISLDYGADFVLVVGRIPEINLERCFIEPSTLKELQKIPENVKAVWNTRDLNTGNRKDINFTEARKFFRGWLCQASFIRTPADIEKGADAVLVGSNLPNFADLILNR